MESEAKVELNDNASKRMPHSSTGNFVRAMTAKN
jgi:hypothetical protein